MNKDCSTLEDIFIQKKDYTKNSVTIVIDEEKKEQEKLSITCKDVIQCCCEYPPRNKKYNCFPYCVISIIFALIFGWMILMIYVNVVSHL